MTLAVAASNDPEVNQQVGEESCDIYTTAGEAPQAAAGLLQAEE